MAIRALLVTLLFLATSPSQDDFPDPHRKLRHIVPWGAGGATDTAMRGFMSYFERHLGIPVVTENIPGGLSAVGLLRVKRARPDGYTLGTLTYDVLTLEHQGLAPIRWEDFEPIGMVTEHPSALIALADRFDDLEAFLRASRGNQKLKTGNVGTGGIWHQHAAAMAQALGIELVHVPYEAGSGAQLAALLGGEVDAIVASLPASLPYLRDGTLRVLAVMSEERDPLVPDAPTFREKGFDLVHGGFRILAAPKGVPEPVRRKLEAAFHDAWYDPAFQAWAQKTALGARFRDAKQTRAYLRETAEKVEALMNELDLGGSR
jgi:tripartite-type tricarboxylate transporter receptor subunit TctC